MQNVRMTLSEDGQKLFLEIDLTQDNGPSASGKTISIASTHGNKPIGQTGAYIRLNVYKYPPRQERTPPARRAPSTLDHLNLD
jgi:hypothetical protein